MPATNGRLEIPADVLAELERTAERSYPEEACGFLLGTARNAHRAVTGFLPTPNRASVQRRSRFSLSAEDARAAETTAFERDVCVLGFYHSHPDRSSEPSPEDELNAWVGYDYLIVPVRAGRAGGTRSYRLDPEGLRFREVPLPRTQDHLAPIPRGESDG